MQSDDLKFYNMRWVSLIVPRCFAELSLMFAGMLIK